MAAIHNLHYYRSEAPANCRMKQRREPVRRLDTAMPDVTVAVLDKFHPQIMQAIESAVPANWTVRFTPDNSLAARAAKLLSGVNRTVQFAGTADSMACMICGWNLSRTATVTSGIAVSNLRTGSRRCFIRQFA